MNPLEIAKTYADEQRSALARKAALKQQESDRRTTFTGQYVGYSANDAVHYVQLDDGGMAIAESVTNGGVKIGQTVTVNRPKGSTIGFMKAMPR
ncbi:MAG TPA: hypothetical protein V6C88_14385 [Chroococcidiopsis sp.]